jgi:hypothetical protein
LSVACTPVGVDTRLATTKNDVPRHYPTQSKNMLAE